VPGHQGHGNHPPRPRDVPARRPSHSVATMAMRTAIASHRTKAIINMSGAPRSSVVPGVERDRTAGARRTASCRQEREEQMSQYRMGIKVAPNVGQLRPRRSLSPAYGGEGGGRSTYCA
jgi:hypothetical protein